MACGRHKRENSGSTQSRYKKVILPKENERDLEDVPEDVRNELKLVTVETIEGLKEALDIECQGLQCHMQEIVSHIPRIFKH